MNRSRIVILLFIAVVISSFFYFDLGRYLTIESLKANQAVFAEFYASHRLGTVLTFIAIYIIQTAISLPGATILTLAAGALFGVVMAAIYVNIGATIGATAAFLVTRYIFHDSVQKKFGSRLEKINTELERSGLNYLLFLRLVPVFPFFLINLGAGLTKIPLRTFFFGTMIGIFPGSLVYCTAGASLASINSVNEIVSPRVLGSFVLLGVFSLVPVLYKKLNKNRDAGF